jgi:hypothetical protein
MKLILHIGTHKTASTSLQHFFTLNRALLRDAGFHYPSNLNSAYVTNFLAAELAFRRGNTVLSFLNKALREATRLGCHTVLLSAESFYAMTAFFLDLYDRRPRELDYWANESRLVSELQRYCIPFDDVQIVCYLRPQDEFASSIYNQLVKSTVGTALPYLDFLARVRPVFDYNQHLQLWAHSFGNKAVQAMRFDTVDGGILQHFCERVLTSACYQKAQQQNFFANTRLSRNVLEVKRIFNATQPDRALAFVAAAVFQELTELYPDLPGHQIFTEPDIHKAFFGDFEEGNRTLSMVSGFSDVLPVCTQGQPTYHGLNPDTALEIYMRFQHQMNVPRKKAEIALRRAARYVKDHIPGGPWLLRPVQAVMHRARLRYRGW